MGSTIVIIVVAALAGLVVLGVVAFNTLRSLDVKAQEALGGIDVQLTRRADLVPNLVNTVKGYAAHEKSVFEEVTGDQRRREGAGAGANFLQLHEQLADTENQPAFARQYYNDAAAGPNQRVVTILWMFFTGLAGVQKRPFDRAPEGQRAPPQVQF